MPEQVCLQIAGVHFTVSCCQACLLPDLWPCYESFHTSSPPEPEDVAVRLELVVGPMPDLSRAKLVFEGSSWSLLSLDERFCIALPPRPGGLPPAWIAVMSSSFTEGTVYCDEALVRDNDGVRGIINPILHRLDQLLVMYLLASREGIIVHSAGAALGGAGMVFGGCSGAGKSTLSRLLRDHADASRLELLSDDRTIIRRIGGGFRVYGTPWAGDAQIGRNASAPLKALYFLRQAESDRIEPVSRSEALYALLPIVSIPWYDAVLVEKSSEFCGRVVDEVPCFNLHFTLGADVVGLLERAAGTRSEA